MKIYSVYINKKQADPDPIFIEEGFSFLALIFQSLWFFYHKIWIPSFSLIIINFLLFFCFDKGLITSFVYYGLDISFAIFVALFANDWYALSLKSKNYEFTDVIVASNIENAKLRFYKNNTDEY